jgi:hypothetical protein
MATQASARMTRGLVAPTMSPRRLSLLAALSIASSLLVAVPFAHPALAAGVEALFDLSHPTGGPFPSDRFTVPDASQLTGLRIQLPKPDCTTRPSDCADIDVLNELDGFNLQPRLSIPFAGPIDVATVTSRNVFLVSLGSASPGGGTGGQVVGVDQIAWDTLSETLHVESDQLLEQHTRYVLLATKELLDENGKEVKATKAFLDFVDESNNSSTGDPAMDAYRESLRGALTEIDAAGIVPRGRVIAASVFTTQSVTAILEKMRDQIVAATPEPANFLLGSDGSPTVFARSAMRRLTFNRQVKADPAAPLSPTQLPLSVLDVVPGAVGTVAFGMYSSPDYRVHPGEFIPPVGTLSGTPLVQRTSEVHFILFLPSSPEPAAGYPVVIFGHGSGTNKTQSGLVAAKMAEVGIATIAIDSPGNGFGPHSTYTVTFTDSSTITLAAGGRGMDQNADGTIGPSEGFGAAPPRAIQGGRDGQQQTAADHLQLVREIEVGMDVDGDDVPDLDPSRVYYLGQSRGGAQGLIFLAVEPSVRAGVFNVTGGSGEFRLAAGSRDGLGTDLATRVPPLINGSGVTSLDGITVGAPYFNEAMPLRDGVPFTADLVNGSSVVVRSPFTNTVAGAEAIQQVIEDIEWASQAGVAVAYAPHIRRSPLNGMSAKAVIVQFANGDRLVPNPMTTAILRAGGLADRATFVRTNLVFPVNPTPFPNDPHLYPHAFMNLYADPALNAIALQAQRQIALFFALDGTDQNLDPFDGTQISDPDEAAPVFQVPVAQPLPEGLNYFP